MLSTQTQIIKWSFPAFALIIGLLWYKRRRADKADPGGITTLIPINKRTNGSCNAHTAPAIKADLNLCDSRIHVDELVSSNLSDRTAEEPTFSPKKVSESVDIPTEKLTSQLTSVPTMSSTGNDQWCEDVDKIPKMKEIELGSNPNESNFEMIAESLREGSSVTVPVNNDEKVTKIFTNYAKNEEPGTMCESTSDKQEDENATNQCSVFENKEIVVFDQKENDTNIQTVQTTQTTSERDSANHSPLSGVLEGSITDEARSEGSTDSGKGGSIRGHAKGVSPPMLYEFYIPNVLVGKLIGRQGTFIQNIRERSEVHNIALRGRPKLRDFKVCTIEGSADAINTALEIIRQKFPIKKFPYLTLEQILPCEMPEEIPLFSELSHLSLFEGVNNDVLVCHITKPNRLFIHVPTHPTYPSLRTLDVNMTHLYDTVESPPAPEKLARGMILVAKWYEKWVRVYVENPDPRGEKNLVRLVDHGGYYTYSNANLRKIRSDFLTLPFQAIEVFIANVKAKNDTWSPEAYKIVERISSRIVAQAQIVAYINSHIYISYYVNIHKYGILSLADELVARGFAEFVPLEYTVPDEDIIPIS